MSSSVDDTTASDEIRTPPSRIVKLFLGYMIGLLLVTLVFSQLNLPYYGRTVWDLFLSGTSWVWGIIPAMSMQLADQFAFVTGAIGVLWLTHTYFSVRRAGKYATGRLDFVFFLLSLWLLVVYFAYDAQVLPLNSSFFYRVALYCAIASVTFSFAVMVSHTEKQNRAASEQNAGLDVMVGFGACAVAIATGFNCASDTSSFWSYQFLNTVLHFVANMFGFGMGCWFYYEVVAHSEGKPAPWPEF